MGRSPERFPLASTQFAQAIPRGTGWACPPLLRANVTLANEQPDEDPHVPRSPEDSACKLDMRCDGPIRDAV
jgi:hypothetical protein